MLRASGGRALRQDVLVADSFQDRVEQYLGRSGQRARGVRVVPLTGDASDRRYFRLISPEGQTMVLAAYPAAFDETLPFLNVTRLLDQMPVPVPDILDEAPDLGLLLLEDLGDVTLQAHLGLATSEEHGRLYREAVRLIAALQSRGAELASDAYLPYGIAFDEAKLGWEMDFFLKHYLLGYRGVQLDEGTHTAIRAELKLLVERLAAEPRVLCHRDYHSRNLMLHSQRLYLIDYQDARLGPDTYDLASLLRDSYVDLSDSTVNWLLAYFLALTGRPEAEAEFRERFDVMSLQRNLKALGTFGYQTTAKQNPVYIQYIPRTLRYVRTNLARYRQFGRLHDLLAAHVDELK
ncbi:aminoglycoside phosphotransferase family protein [Luteitalea sp.]|jgi:aminoglycoside/choline kinase family phosphotransferase|uniref:aminoglycoside phosphotransferase family protein n=1 Tax=Luteitalea sp. TaxID=2004800 RepID=UPI0037CC2E6F